MCRHRVGDTLCGHRCVIDNYDTLLSTIIDVRKSAGHTQRSIASAIDVSYHAIAFMEVQKSALTIDVMLKICDTCGAMITIKKKGGEACGLENQQN